MGLYFNGEKVAAVYGAGSSTTDIVFEYTYDEIANPAATVQSVTTRLKDYATSTSVVALTAEVQRINNNYTSLNSSISQLNVTVDAIQSALVLKQENLSFDGDYDATTNKVATVNTVISKSTEIAGEVAAEKIAEWVSDAPEDLNTLKEIAAWINKHPESVAELNALIAENSKNISFLDAMYDVLESAVRQNSTAITGLSTGLEDGTKTVKNATRAALAEKDSNGKVIHETYATKGVAGSMSISTNAWDEDLEDTRTFYEMGENDAIFFSPATIEDKEIIEHAGLFISTSGRKVTFKCRILPEETIAFKYFIVRGV